MVGARFRNLALLERNRQKQRLKATMLAFTLLNYSSVIFNRVKLLMVTLKAVAGIEVRTETIFD